MSANKKLLDRYVERYNAGDLDAVMDLYAEDAVQNRGRARVTPAVSSGVAVATAVAVARR